MKCTVCIRVTYRLSRNSSEQTEPRHAACPRHLQYERRAPTDVDADFIFANSIVTICLPSFLHYPFQRSEEDTWPCR